MMKRTHKAGDIVPLGDLMREYVRCLAIGDPTKLFKHQEAEENERLIRATLNDFWVKLANLPGEIEIEDE